MFHPDHDLPTGSDLLAELGIRPDLVREVVEHDRAMRCPERAAIHRQRRFADLVPEPPVEGHPRRAGPDEPGVPVPAGRRTEWRWRRA